MSSSTIIVLKTLTKYVAAQLEERAFCVVFENDLEHCWARKDTTRAKRERDIQSFAESQGWTAAIVEGRVRHEGNLSKVGTHVRVLARPYSEELLRR
jgi:hypothetical protein